MFREQQGKITDGNEKSAGCGKDRVQPQQKTAEKAAVEGNEFVG